MRRYHIHILIAVFMSLLLGACRTTSSSVFHEFQDTFQYVHQDFTDALSAHEPERLRSREYQANLNELRESYRQNARLFRLRDTLRKANNDAVLSILNGDYNAAQRALERSPKNLENSQIQQLHALARILKKEHSSQDSLLNTTTASNSNKNYNSGLVFWNQKNFGNAEAALSLAIQEEPKNTLFRITRGDFYYSQGKFELALQDFKKIRDENNYYGIQAYLKTGSVALAMKKYEEAEENFKYYLYIEKKKNIFEAHLGLANALYGRKNFRLSEKEFRLAVHYKNHSAFAHIGLGNALCSQQNYKLAMAEFERALEIEPSNQFAHLGKAIVLYKSGNYPDAYEAFKNAKTAVDLNNPEMTDVLLCKAITCQNLGKERESNADFETIMKLDPESAVPYAALSAQYIAKLQFAKAEELLNQAIAKDPDNDKIRSNRGNLNLYFEKFEKASGDFYRALAINPRNVSAKNGLAITLLENDEMEKALSALDSLIYRNPSKAYLYNNRGIVKAYLGVRNDMEHNQNAAGKFYAESLADFNKAHQTDASRQFYYVNVGNAHKNINDFPEALKNYQIYTSKSGVNNMSVIYAAQNNKKDARKYFDIALQLDSGSSVINYNKARLLKEYSGEMRASSNTSGKSEGIQQSIQKKYSKDGFITMYLYDGEFEKYTYENAHFLPVHFQNDFEYHYLPNYKMSLMPFTGIYFKSTKKKSKQVYREPKVYSPKRKGNVICPPL